MAHEVLDVHPLDLAGHQAVAEVALVLCGLLMGCLTFHLGAVLRRRGSGLRAMSCAGHSTLRTPRRQSMTGWSTHTTGRTLLRPELSRAHS